MPKSIGQIETQDRMTLAAARKTASKLAKSKTVTEKDLNPLYALMSKAVLSGTKADIKRLIEGLK
jgi:hypothetical protein